jgi:hypothetical protein
MVLSSAPAWENVGQRGLATFAGVIVMEATKQIYAAQPQKAARQRVYMPARDLPRGINQGTARDGGEKVNP